MSDCSICGGTGFEIVVPAGEIAVTAAPTPHELHVLRIDVDPTNARHREF